MLHVLTVELLSQLWVVNCLSFDIWLLLLSLLLLFLLLFEVLSHHHINLALNSRLFDLVLTKPVVFGRLDEPDLVQVDVRAHLAALILVPLPHGL